MSPEYVATLTRQSLPLDSPIDYVREGKESWRIVPTFHRVRVQPGCTAIRCLGGEFEFCVHGLNRIKSDLEVLRHEQQHWKHTLLS